MKETERKNIINDLIGKASGYKIALMTTFNFEMRYFERAVLNKLTAQNVNTVSIFVDANEFTKSITDAESTYLGLRYMVSPVSIKGAFHPKVILLLGDKRARLIVGSANITMSGHAINNEIYSYVEYSEKNPEYQSVIVDAINFFLKINRISYQLDNDVIDRIKELPYFKKAAGREDLFMVHNVDKPILSQVEEIIAEPIKEVHVAVPYYDNNLSALAAIKNNFPKSKVHLHIQDDTSTFPLDYYNKHDIDAKINAFDSFRDNDSYAFYHGKVFLFKGKNRSYILYGSANCTQAALIKTYVNGGNVECCFLSVGEAEEFDTFFENLVPCDVSELTVSDATYESNTSGAFAFKCAKYDEKDKLLKLYFSARPGIVPTVRVYDSELKYKIGDNSIEVRVPKDVAEILPGLFDTIFKYDGNEETVRCWIYNPESLQNFRREKDGGKGIDSFDIDSVGDKYLQDRINYLNAEQTCLPEMEEHRKKLAHYNQQKIDNEEGADDTDDFVIDVDIPEEYEFEYRKDQKVDKVRRLFIRSLFLRYKSIFSDPADPKTGTKPPDKDDGNDEEKETRHREPTTAEKRFERFMRSKIKGMTDLKYVDIIKPMHYLALVEVVMDIFTKYTDVDLFYIEDMVETRVDLFKCLLLKDFSDVDEDNIEYIVLLECYKALAENHLLIADDDDLEWKEQMNEKNRELLKAMDKKYSIRSTYHEHVKDLLKTEVPGVREGYYKVFTTYLENLFGYRNAELLEKYVCKELPGASVSINGSTVEVTAPTENTKACFQLDMNMLREIRNYSWNVSRVDTIILVYKNSSDKGFVDSIEHYISLRTKSHSMKTVYRNGNIIKEDPEFISI